MIRKCDEWIALLLKKSDKIFFVANDKVFIKGLILIQL